MISLFFFDLSAYFIVLDYQKVGLHGLHFLGLILIYIIDNQIIDNFFEENV